MYTYSCTLHATVKAPSPFLIASRQLNNLLCWSVCWLVAVSFFGIFFRRLWHCCSCPNACFSFYPHYPCPPAVAVYPALFPYRWIISLPLQVQLMLFKTSLPYYTHQKKDLSCKDSEMRRVFPVGVEIWPSSCLLWFGRWRGRSHDVVELSPRGRF